MIRAPRPKLWHLSALVLASALAMALAREAATADRMAGFGLILALVAAACHLGSVFVGAKLAGAASDRLIERGRARDDPAGRALAVLVMLASFAITLGVAGLGLLAILVVLVLVAMSPG